MISQKKDLVHKDFVCLYQEFCLCLDLKILSPEPLSWGGGSSEMMHAEKAAVTKPNEDVQEQHENGKSLQYWNDTGQYKTGT